MKVARRAREGRLIRTRKKNFQARFWEAQARTIAPGLGASTASLDERR